MRRTVLLGLLTALPCAVSGQQLPDVVDILKKVAAVYQSSKTYVLEADATERGNSGHLRLAFKTPNRYRMEGVGFGDDPAFAQVLAVDDGTTIWFYLPKTNQYMSFAASDLTDDAPGDLGDLSPAAVDAFMMSRYRDAGDAEETKFLREEVIEVAGAKVACFVVQVLLHGDRNLYTWWIDKGSNRILREDHAGSSALFTTISLNETVPDRLFHFTPPPGAKKIELQR